MTWGKTPRKLTNQTTSVFHANMVTEEQASSAAFNFQSSFSAKVERHPAILNINPAAANRFFFGCPGGQVKLCA